jgi:hypothetical protein
MKKSQLPELFEELTLRDSKDSTAKPAAKFSGTDNPRELRAIHELSQRSRSRTELQSITGASNLPDLVSNLRCKGLEVPCDRVPVVDRDGKIVYPGIYSLNDHDRRKISVWQSRGSANHA